MEQIQATCVYKNYLAALSGWFFFSTRKYPHCTKRTLRIISQNYLAIKKNYKIVCKVFRVLKFIAWLHVGSSADEGSEFASCHHLRGTSLQLNKRKFIVFFSKPFQVPHTAVPISASRQVTLTPLMHTALVCCNMLVAEHAVLIVTRFMHRCAAGSC